MQQSLFIIAYYESGLMQLCFVAAQSEQEALRCTLGAHPHATDMEVYTRLEFMQIVNFQLPERIRSMREAQQFYFRSRGTQQLAAAKALEKEVDKWLEAFGQSPKKAPQVVQPNLF